ncbi:MAG: polysaccharide pyruvyl transferase family protein [Lachnospiraceae bacterium]|nr:polysaccharide pyruvyl transferase family protein [Lachnospiraceae bacterium]
MKVAVITRHAITNYGSLLQAIATQQVIENLGYTCEIIDYVRVDESYRERERTLLKRKPEWNNNPIKRLIYLILRQPESIATGKKFEKEQQEYLNLSNRYDSADSLKENPPTADIFLTGSDQVWGPVENGTYDDTYCLSFTNEKKIAYAASFGHTEMNEELKLYFKKWLSRYNSISVREDSAVRILSDMSLKATQVLDPTLLLDSNYWADFLKPIKYRKYVLVYQLHNDKRLGEYAEKIATEMGLPLIRISTSYHQVARSGKFVWCPNVGEFLSYVKNAECLITDSFHGTAFAINFNTQFIEVLPNNNTGTRNISILKLTGLLDRVLTNTSDLSLASKKIDFKYANKVIKEKRAESIKILKEMIEE